MNIVTALVGLPTILIAILVVSAVAKLREPVGTADAFVSLRLPAFLLRLRAPALLPWFELGLAALLTFAGGALQVLASAACLLLFCAYLVVIARASMFDEEVSCSCFGSLGLGTVSARTTVRNVVFVILAIGAGVRSVGDPRSVVEAAGSEGTGGWLAIQLVTVVVTWLIVAEPDQRRPGAAAERIDADHELLDFERTPIPYLRIEDETGAGVELRSLASRSAQALFVLSLSCGPCLRVRDGLSEFALENPELEARIVVTREPGPGEIPAGVQHLVDRRNDVGAVFALRTPGMVVLGADGRIAAGPVSGEREVLELMAAVSVSLAAARAD